MISYRYGFLFIHIYKTGGTSIRLALSRFAEHPEHALVNRVARRLGRSPAWPWRRWRAFPDHVTAAEVRKHLGPETWRQLYKFAFVRNPWDWQVSLYEFIRQTASHEHHRIVERMSFAEYLDWGVTDAALQQETWVTDEAGQLIVDYVGRVRSLESDFSAITSRLGIPASLPRLNVSRRRDYRRYYDDRTQERIARVYQPDIRRFGFAFDDGVRLEEG